MKARKLFFYKSGYGDCDPTPVLGESVHDGCNPQTNLAHLAEKYGIPVVDGHCVTREFGWLLEYSAGTDPDALTQNLKNALLPQWHCIRDGIHSNLRRAMRDIPIQGDKDNLSLSVMVAIQSSYMNLLTATPRTHHLSHLKQQLKQLPSSWVTGWFERGTSALWVGCKFFFVSTLPKSFFPATRTFFRSAMHAFAWHGL